MAAILAYDTVAVAFVFVIQVLNLGASVSSLGTLNKPVGGVQVAAATAWRSLQLHLIA